MTSPTDRPTGWRAELVEANYELSTLVDDWLLTLQTADRSPNTLALYAGRVRLFMAWFETEHDQPARCADLGEGDNGKRLLRRYLLHQQRAGRAAQTRNADRHALRSFSSWLAEESYIDRDSLRDVPQVKAPKRRIPVFSDADLDAVEQHLQRYADRERNLALWYTLLGTGLRADELATLRLSDLELRDRRGQPLRVGALTIVGKGDRQRRVGLGEAPVAQLRRYLRVRPTPETDQDAAAVFLTRQGRRLTSDRLRNLFASWRRALGIRHLHPHTCRHTFATRFLQPDEAGRRGDISELCLILGHASVQQTMHYLHLESSDQAVRQQQIYCPVTRRERDDRARRLSNARSTNASDLIGRAESPNPARRRGVRPIA